MSKQKRTHCQTDASETEVIPSEYTEVLPSTEDLIAEIKLEADKLQRDNATRGDLKILTRSLKELRYAFSVFKKYRMQRKVTVFGSARTPHEHPTYQHAVEFGKQMAAEGWMVLTGAGGGIMEAAHEGSGRDMAMGVNIMLPFEQDANPIISGDEKLVHLKYFFTRKLLFVKEVHAIALYPGGFGTMDEVFETLTLVQTGKRDLMPIVCLDEPEGTYWPRWQEFVEDELLKGGLISPEDMSLFKFTTSVEEAIEEILGFYSVYHSMRYVHGRLVIRLTCRPDDAFMERLNDEFPEITASGKITRAEADPVEADDSHLADLPRISMDFDRKQLGRLRQMVDFLNQELEPTMLTR